MTFIGASPIVLALSAADNTVLSLKNVQVLYDRAIEAVRDVSLDVPAGAIVALLGSNGACKSTILKAISGVLEQEDGEIVNAQIVDAIFEALVVLNRDSGLTILLVEQNARLALEVASYGYILENGRDLAWRAADGGGRTCADGAAARSHAR